jgi:hypothetical protein
MLWSKITKFAKKVSNDQGVKNLGQEKRRYKVSKDARQLRLRLYYDWNQDQNCKEPQGIKLKESIK